MCQFIETIRIEQGKPLHIAYHNQRMNNTRSAFWSASGRIDLNDYIQLPPCLTDESSASSSALSKAITHKEAIKCRIVYSDQIEGITYSPYHMRSVRTLRLLSADTLEYAYKYSNRDVLTNLFNQRGFNDEVLIVKNGTITDTSIANIALFDGERWFTPKYPLLKGTQRARLLETRQIKEKEITVDDLYNYTKITIFNALIPFQTLTLEVNPKTITWEP